jgi:uncharacterized membrane protein
MKTMQWQTAMAIQIIASSILALVTRWFALTERKLFFTVGLVSYAVIAAMGCIYLLLFGNGISVPHARTWLYLVGEGVLIPISWLLNYRAVGLFGASNAQQISVVTYISTALLGFWLLHEPFTWTFMTGSLLIFVSIITALRIQPDATHHQQVSWRYKAILVGGMAVSFAVGIYCEKQALIAIGPWDYALFGWSMQCLGAVMLWLLLGRGERVHVTPRGLQKAAILGVLMSLAGLLFIYALSKGTLSSTVVAASAKIGLVTVLAALFLREDNNLYLRIFATACSVTGLWMLLG